MTYWGDKMKIVFNDIALAYQKENKFEAIKVFEKFVNTILELEKNRIQSDLVVNESLKGKKLCDNYCLEQLYNESKLRADTKRVILRIFTKIKIIDIDTNNIFELNSVRSKLCAWTLENQNIVMSLDMHDCVNKEYLEGNVICGGVVSKVSIPNLCDQQHVYTHSDILNIRIYEENPKHKIGYGWGSPMDLSSTEAQKVLDQAVLYEDNKNCLVNKYNEKFYVFRRHINNCYHGYIDNSIPENIKSKLS